MTEATTKPKGRRGDGSVYTTKDGRLRASLPVRDPLTGKPGRVYLSARTPGEMRAKIAKARSDAGRVANAPTLTDFADAWLRRIRHRVADRSWRGYGSVLRVWVLPSIGHVEVSRLTPGHVEAMQADLAARGLAPGTVARARRVLVTVLADAERDGVILRNPARLARPPRAADAPVRALPPEAITRLVDVARGAGTVGSVILLALSTGLRRGELLALRWEDVTADTLTVRQGKTARARRTLALPVLAHEAVERERGNGSGYVFTDELGRRLGVNALADGWHIVREQAGVPDARLHDLRHTLATTLLARGVPVADVSAMLGHASPATTWRTYAHVVPGGRERTAAAVDAALGGES